MKKIVNTDGSVERIVDGEAEKDDDPFGTDNFIFSLTFHIFSARGIFSIEERVCCRATKGKTINKHDKRTAVVVTLVCVFKVPALSGESPIRCQHSFFSIQLLRTIVKEQL